MVVFCGRCLYNVGRACYGQAVYFAKVLFRFLQAPLWGVFDLAVRLCPTVRSADTATPWGNVGGFEAR